MAVPSWLPALRGADARIEVDLLVRMLFSCLVDADFLDTEAHFAGRVAPRLAPAQDMGALAERFEKRRAEFFHSGENAQAVAGLCRKDFAIRRHGLQCLCIFDGYRDM